MSANPPRAVFGAVLGTAIAALAAAPSLAQRADPPRGSVEQMRGGWQSYVNDRYGTRITYPADIFAPEEAPENGDGRRFYSADAQIEVYAWQNIDGETARSLKRKLVGSEGYTNVTYSPSGDSWLVISGYRGERIFYEKYFLRGGVIHAFGMEFPADRKPFYAPIVERVEDSFRAR